MSQKNNDSISEFCNYLQTIAEIDAWEIELIAANCKSIHIKKGAILLRDGEICRTLYFVNSGCLSTSYTNPNGSEFTRCIAMEKSFCWSNPSFLDESPSTEFIQSLMDSNLIIISKVQFEKMVNECPGFRLIYMKSLEQLMMDYSERIKSFLTMTAIERYYNLLKNNPSIILTLPNKIVASFLGIKQESLSRLKKQR